MKHILLLTDFSENSKNAIYYALQLFKDEMCVFHMLYVKSATSYISDDLIASGNQSIYQSLIKKEKTKLTKLVNMVKVDFQNNKHSFEIMVDYDVFTDAVNQAVKAKKIDLIVMGTNGVTGAKEVVFGSNTINVIRHAECTTLVIPEGYKYRQPKEMFLALDGFDSVHGKSFSELVKFISQFKLLLHVLRINPYGLKSEMELSDSEDIALALKGRSFVYYVVNNIPMQFAVACYLQTNPIDMMTLIVQKETLFERFFIGSSTTQISKEVVVPLLILHSS